MFSRSFLLCASASLYFLSALSRRFSRIEICFAIACDAAAAAVARAG